MKAHIYAFSKYLLAFFTKGVLSYYIMIIAISVLTLLGGGQSEINGGGLLLTFALGLMFFKDSFLFSQANNISRRSFYVSTLLSILALSAILSIFDSILAAVLEGLITYDPIFLNRILYQMTYLGRIPLTAILLTLSFSGGWMTRMLYYRANTPLKMVISLSPIILISSYERLDRLTGNRLGASFLSFILRVLGLTGEVPDPYPAMLSFALFSVVVWGFNYVLMYRAPVKV